MNASRSARMVTGAMARGGRFGWWGWALLLAPSFAGAQGPTLAESASGVNAPPAEPAATELPSFDVPLPSAARARELATEVMVRAMRTELARTMSTLRLPNRQPAYFGAYWLVDVERARVQAHLGALLVSERQEQRRLRVELRVGDRLLDNSNFSAFEETGGFAGATPELMVAPLDDEPRVLQRFLWTASDVSYRAAVEHLDKKRAQESAEVQLEVPPADFSDQRLESMIVERQVELPGNEGLEAIAVAVSSVFANYPEIDDSAVTIDAMLVERTLVTSEGVISREPNLLVQLQVHCATQAEDGMPLGHTATFHGALDPGKITQRAHELARELVELRGAELAGDSFGPVLFEGVAAAQVTHELLSTALGGTPVSGEQEGVFSRRLGKRVLPESFDVIDDPSIDGHQGLPLIGSYIFDDEGVRGERVRLVSRGRLRNLLMSRTPSHEFALSNGHGRSGLSGWPRGVASNLILSTKAGTTRANLRQRLLRAVAEEGAEYGVVIERLAERAFATSGMAPPLPERMFKLYPDGRMVLVRGATLSEMNVRDLRGILAAGRTPNVYSYVIPWASGIGSPSSVVAPDLLFEEVELTKAKRSTQRPKVLPRPGLAPAKAAK